jgi:signal transduction histidine kinase
MDHPAGSFALHARNRPFAGHISRVVLRLYASTVGGAGAIALLFGPMWLSDLHLAGQPFGRAALLRVAGAAGVAAACAAAGAATVDDARARSRYLGWFATGPLVLVAVVLIQRIAIWGAGPIDTALWLLVAVTALLGAAAHPHTAAALGQVVSGSRASRGEQQRAAREAQIREAAGQEERNRLARDLHDSVKQQVFAIQTAAATAQTRFSGDPPGAQEAIERIRAAARETMTELEAMLDQLRAVPLGNAGLVSALRRQADALGFRTGARVDVRIGTLPADNAVAPGTQQVFFRVAQEALANVARHARARHVLVTLGSLHGRLELQIKDDGAGIAPDRQRHGTGLANMAQRAAEN